MRSERLAQHEYHQALTFLHGQSWHAMKIRFSSSRATRAEQLGLKATARQLIGELPPEGHEAYELLHGGDSAAAARGGARRPAIRTASPHVVRQFFHTAAGYEAALVLAQMEADQGHHLAAAELYRELIDTPHAAAQFEPQLSVLAALESSGRRPAGAAAATLRSLIETQPGGDDRAGRQDGAAARRARPIWWRG